MWQQNSLQKLVVRRSTVNSFLAAQAHAMTREDMIGSLEDGIPGTVLQRFPQSDEGLVQDPAVEIASENHSVPRLQVSPN